MKSVNIQRLKADWALFLILSAAFALRIYNISSHNLWFDEVASQGVARFASFDLTFGGFIWNNMEKTPPLYYFVLKQWINFFGLSEFSLRFPSAIFDFLTVLLVYKSGRFVFNKEVAVIATFLISLSPFHLWYSQEARMFTLAGFFTILNFLLFIKILKSRGLKYWLGYALSLAALISTTYYGIFYLLAQFLVIIFIKGFHQFFLKWFFTVCASLIIPAILLSRLFFNQFFSFKNYFWTFKTGPAVTILFTLNNFICGYNGTRYTYFMCLSLFALLIVGYLSRSKGKRMVVLTLCFVPILTVFIISKRYHLYLDRHLMMFSPFFYLILAQGICQLPQRIIRIFVMILFGVIFFLTVPNYYLDKFDFRSMPHGVQIKRPVKSAVEFFLKNRRPFDALGFSNFSVEFPFHYYLARLSPDDFKDCRLPRLFFAEENIAYFSKFIDTEKKWDLSEDNNLDRESFFCKYFVKLDTSFLDRFKIKRLWLFSTAWENFQNVGYPDNKTMAWLNSNFIKERELTIGKINISVYNTSKIFHRRQGLNHEIRSSP